MRCLLGSYRQLLWRYLAPQRGAVALMAVLLAGSIALQVLAPQVVRQFIDAARAGASTATLGRAALLFLGATALQQVLGVAVAFWSARVAWAATNALRGDLAAHLLDLDLGFHAAHPTC